MTLRKRVDRLGGKRGTEGAGPAIIFLCDASNDEPIVAMLMGGDNVTREDGESANAFTARVEALSNAQRVDN